MVSRGRATLVAVVDTVIADAVDRAVDGLFTLSQANERLMNEVRGLDPASYNREHLDALRAAVCLMIAPDGTCRGDSSSYWWS